ncbi:MULTISPECIES: flagellar brake protein [Luteimonas]|uniref:flagellar brake protein n=1 Tax=Luteimonas TaxID=83614 RepID=UPI000C7E2CC5|nr:MULTISPECIES: flagellar brake protein [Luteimonas]
MTVADAHSLLLDDAEQSPFALREPREVAQVLRALVNARAMISASLLPGGHPCPTALLAVHDDGTMILDGNRHEGMNRRVAAATRLVCSTQLDLVPIRFRLPTPLRITWEGYPAFTVPWPETLLRLQRREMYRLQVSPTAPAIVHVGDDDTPPDPGQPGLRVLDISGGGIAIAVPDGSEHHFAAQTRLRACLLRLAEADPMPVVLDVVHIGRFDVRGAPHWRAGCHFVDMPGAHEKRVLQYIFQVERQRNARQRRGG